MAFGRQAVGLLALAGASFVALASTATPIRGDQEMSWTVKILKTRTNKLVSGFKVCLLGRA